MPRAFPVATLDLEELAELRSTVRDVAAQAGYPERVRALEGSTTGYDVELWRTLATEIGLAAVGLPEEAGGLGGLAEILAVAEELGASLAPVPFLASTVLSGQVLAGAGPVGQPFLERIVEGAVAAPALTDDRGVWSAQTSCRLDGGTVTGTVRFVPAAVGSDFLVVAARDDDGPQVAVVEASDAFITALTPLDFSRPMGTVTFDAAPATALTSGADGASALSDGVDIALLATAADQLGGSQHCFDLTLEYVKLRRQFNREIGSFQAIKHRLADALMQVEMARSGLDRLTWDEPQNLAADAAVAKAWGTTSYLALTAETIQLHGGVGFTWEHDAHLYFRRARYDAAFLGDAAFHRERVATLLDW
jgi:alkylation response protein AidB-like acyl-CoA dehydrogenase